MKISLVKTPKPRQFGYKPRFYDAQKESDEKRRIEIEQNIKNPDRINLRREMQNKWGRKDALRSNSRKYAMVVYIVLLIIILYFFFL